MAKSYNWYNMVTITVPRGMSGWRPEGEVWVNGRRWRFPVGVETQVPEPVAEVLQRMIDDWEANKPGAGAGGVKTLFITLLGDAPTAETPSANMTYDEVKSVIENCEPLVPLMVVNTGKDAPCHCNVFNTFYIMDNESILLATDTFAVKYNPDGSIEQMNEE